MLLIFSFVFFFFTSSSSTARVRECANAQCFNENIENVIICSPRNSKNFAWVQWAHFFVCLQEIYHLTLITDMNMLLSSHSFHSQYNFRLQLCRVQRWSIWKGHERHRHRERFEKLQLRESESSAPSWTALWLMELPFNNNSSTTQSIDLIWVNLHKFHNNLCNVKRILMISRAKWLDEKSTRIEHKFTVWEFLDYRILISKLDII